jgi:hydrogenase maturation protease
MTTLVLGLGNDLLADEGIGVHAVRWLQQQAGRWPGVEFMDGGTLSFTLAGPVAEAERLIVIDATQLHSSPGTVRLFRNEEMDAFLNSGKRKSVHEVGLIDLMSMAHLSGTLPVERALIGIQPQQVDWREHPTPAVAAALPAVGELIDRLLKEWTFDSRLEGSGCDAG